MDQDTKKSMKKMKFIITVDGTESELSSIGTYLRSVTQTISERRIWTVGKATIEAQEVKNK